MPMVPAGGNFIGRLTGPSTVNTHRRAGSMMHPVANRQRSGSAFASFPVGLGDNASVMAVSTGGLACRMSAANSVDVAMSGYGEMDSDMVGIAAVAVAPYGMTALRELVAALLGNNAMSAAPDAFADARCAMLVNQLTEGDVRGAVIDAEIEPGVSLKHLLRLLLAVAAGKTEIVPGAGDSATVTFRDINDTANRIIATMDGSERVNITLDPE